MCTMVDVRTESQDDVTLGPFGAALLKSPPTPLANKRTAHRVRLASCTRSCRQYRHRTDCTAASAQQCEGDLSIAAATERIPWCCWTVSIASKQSRLQSARCRTVSQVATSSSSSPMDPRALLGLQQGMTRAVLLMLRQFRLRGAPVRPYDTTGQADSTEALCSRSTPYSAKSGAEYLPLTGLARRRVAAPEPE